MQFINAPIYTFGVVYTSVASVEESPLRAYYILHFSKHQISRMNPRCIFNYMMLSMCRASIIYDMGIYFIQNYVRKVFEKGFFLYDLVSKIRGSKNVNIKPANNYLIYNLYTHTAYERMLPNRKHRSSI